MTSPGYSQLHGWDYVGVSPGMGSKPNDFEDFAEGLSPRAAASRVSPLSFNGAPVHPSEPAANTQKSKVSRHLSSKPTFSSRGNLQPGQRAKYVPSTAFEVRPTSPHGLRQRQVIQPSTSSFAPQRHLTGKPAVPKLPLKSRTGRSIRYRNAEMRVYMAPPPLGALPSQNAIGPEKYSQHNGHKRPQTARANFGRATTSGSGLKQQWSNSPKSRPHTARNNRGAPSQMLDTMNHKHDRQNANDNANVVLNAVEEGSVTALELSKAVDNSGPRERRAIWESLATRLQERKPLIQAANHLQNALDEHMVQRFNLLQAMTQNQSQGALLLGAAVLRVLLPLLRGSPLSGRVSLFQQKPRCVQYIDCLCSPIDGGYITRAASSAHSTTLASGISVQPLGECYLNQVFETARSVQLDNLNKFSVLPLSQQRRKTSLGMDVHSNSVENIGAWIGVPILGKEYSCIGAISIGFKESTVEKVDRDLIEWTATMISNEICRERENALQTRLAKELGRGWQLLGLWAGNDEEPSMSGFIDSMHDLLDVLGAESLLMVKCDEQRNQDLPNSNSEENATTISEISSVGTGVPLTCYAVNSFKKYIPPLFCSSGDAGVIHKAISEQETIEEYGDISVSENSKFSLIPDLHACSADLDLLAMVCIPIFDNELVGVLNVTRKLQPFSQDVIYMLETLSTVIWQQLQQATMAD